MSLPITLSQVDLGFGGPALLEQVNVSIPTDQRIAIVGRNGCGKSSLLKLLAGELVSDEGTVSRDIGIRIGSLPQDIPESLPGNALQVATHDEAEESALRAMLTRLGIEAEQPYDAMSGGQKRRTILARALSLKPDLLLLDEPTNHLDPASIEWLEQWLLRPGMGLIFISHDRRFMANLATAVIEIDRGRLSLLPGDFQNFLRRQKEQQHARELDEARFLKRLSEEEVWIRKGIQARRTRNEGRVRRLKEMREQYRTMRAVQGDVKLKSGEIKQSGKLVTELENVNFSFDNKPIVTDLSLTIQRGEHIGVIGVNGVGKTTLINLILGNLQPVSGHVKRGTSLEVAYFDQHRSALNHAISAMDNVSEGREFITVGGKERHIISYMQDFLFTPDQARGPIERFSGGELSRLLLARLFSRGANLLVMDEPTNDLDIETLELLEELLTEFKGTLLVSSHDRAFLDNVATSVLFLDGSGQVELHLGGYSDWAQHYQQTKPAKKPKPAKIPVTSNASSKKKLSYHLQRELDRLPAQIEQLEQTIAQIHHDMNQPGFFGGDADIVSRKTRELQAAEASLESCFERWEVLENQ